MKEGMRRNTSEVSQTDFIRLVLNGFDLIWIIAKKEIKAKYSQTFIGLGWTLLQPITGIFIYSIFFGSILNWSTSNLPYAVYVLIGLIGWNYFVFVVSNGVYCYKENSELIKNIYVPLLVFPLAKALVGLFDLMLYVLLLVPFVYYYNISISWNIVFLPLVLLYNIIISLSFSLFFISISVVKKDILHLIPYLVTFGIWLTPVFFTIDIYPQLFRNVIELNPLNHVVSSWRWSIFGVGKFHMVWVWGFLFSVFFLLFSLRLFNRKQLNLRDNV